VNTNSVIQRLNGLDAVHYYMSNEESYTNGEYLAISSANTNILTIAVSNITNFAVENLHIYSADSLEEGKVLWKSVPYSVISTNENQVIVRVDKKQNGFYSAYYTANVPVVDVKGRLSVGGVDIIDVIDTMSGATAANVVKDATNALATVAHTGNYNDLTNKYTDEMAGVVATNTFNANSDYRISNYSSTFIQLYSGNIVNCDCITSGMTYTIGLLLKLDEEDPQMRPIPNIGYDAMICMINSYDVALEVYLVGPGDITIIGDDWSTIKAGTNILSFVKIRQDSPNLNPVILFSKKEIK